MLISVFDVTNALLWNTLKILLNTYSDIISKDILHEKTVRMINTFWNDSSNQK